eukprot:maker-scaffold198_size266703-snap-gene-0.23 protein:Tk12343 transcript:maker-scaffold198_size266703-snap-gene-0.23-mRNA-1 annotation:"hypothetical protein"
MARCGTIKATCPGTLTPSIEPPGVGPICGPAWAWTPRPISRCIPAPGLRFEPPAGRPMALTPWSRRGGRSLNIIGYGSNQSLVIRGRAQRAEDPQWGLGWRSGPVGPPTNKRG